MPRRLITPAVARIHPREEGETPWRKDEFWTDRYDDDLARLQAHPIWLAAPLADQMRDLMMKTERFICWEVRRTKDGPQVGLIWHPKGIREETYLLLDHPEIRIQFTKYDHNVGLTEKRVYVAGGTDRSATAMSYMIHALNDSDPRMWPPNDFYGRNKLRSPEHQAIREAKENASLMRERHANSGPEDLIRRRIEMRRLKEALDRMPHPSWGNAPLPTRSGTPPATELQFVGDYVVKHLTASDREYLAWSIKMADGEREHLSDWHDGLGNCGLSVGYGRKGKATLAEMRRLCEDLAEFRTDPRCAGEWSRLIQGLVQTGSEELRIRHLFEVASGISDEFLWGTMESEEAEEEAREAVEALNRRRDALIQAGRDVPRAHINWNLFYPQPDNQIPLPSLGEHRRSPEA